MGALPCMPQLAVYLGLRSSAAEQPSLPALMARLPHYEAFVWRAALPLLDLRGQQL